MKKKLPYVFIGALIMFIVLFVIDEVDDRYQASHSTVPQIGTVQSPTPSPSIDEKRLFSLVQEWRYDNGYAPYRKNESLCKLAEQRTEEIIVNFSHDGSETKKKFVQSMPNGSLGEILARDYKTEEEYLQGWLNSPKHAEALRHNYTHSCLKCKDGYCAQIFSTF